MLKKFLVSFIIVLAGLSITSVRAAQTPTNGVAISWSTNTYTPASFPGKKLPTSHSPITAWVTVFQNGKAVDASNYHFSWYVGSTLIQSGQNLQKITFNAPKGTELILNLQARVQDENGALSVANIQVPVINPRVAIEANYPGKIVSGNSATVTALPYFFNISTPDSLTYSWQVNGVSSQSAENPTQANINFGNNFSSGSKIGIRLNVANSSDNTAASANLSLTYQKI